MRFLTVCALLSLPMFSACGFSGSGTFSFTFNDGWSSGGSPSSSPAPTETSRTSAPTAITGEDHLRAIENLAAGIVGSLPGDQLRVAVYPFKNADGERHEASAMLESLLPVFISKVNSEATVFTRRRMEEVLAELQLQNTDFFDRESAVRVGELVGATQIVAGDVFDASSSFQVVAELLLLETGEQLTSAVANIPLTDDVIAMTGIPDRRPVAGPSDPVSTEPSGVSNSGAAGVSRPVSMTVGNDWQASLMLELGDLFTDLGKYSSAATAYERATEFGVNVEVRMSIIESQMQEIEDSFFDDPFFDE